MRRLLCADLYRLFCKPWLWLCAGTMAALAVVLALIQYAAMDYTVAADRVLFLPMAFYGVAAAALTSVVTGSDFSDGVVKNKIIAGHARGTVYLSAQIAAWLGCVTVYLTTLLTSAALGLSLFEVNVAAGKIAGYAALGVLTSLAYASIFCMITLSAGNRSAAIVVCMALAFAMLFLCLHTNQVLMQAAQRDGLPNPAHAAGAKRVVYEYLHDLNPSGQAAQLSAMNCLNAARFAATDLLWICLSVFAGPRLFARRDIRC